MTGPVHCKRIGQETSRYPGCALVAVTMLQENVDKHTHDSSRCNAE